MYTLQDLAKKAKPHPSAVQSATQKNGLGADASLSDYDRAQEQYQSAGRDDDMPPPEWQFPSISVSDIIAWLLRYWLLIIICTICGLAAGIGYGMLAKQRFTAYTDIFVAPSNLQLVPNDVYATSLQAESQLMDIESKLRLLTSVNVLQRVVDELKLQDDPEFVNNDRSKTLPATTDAGDEMEASASTKNFAALRELSTRIDARRPERSYLINLGVWSHDPEKVVVLTNTLAKAFQEEVAQNDQDGAARAAKALSEPLAELKQAATQAEEKVAQFRSAQGLQTSAGELFSTQSLGQINTQLVEALTRQAEAQSRYNELTMTGGNQSDPSNALQSPTLTALRTQYATLRQRIDSLAMTYGSRYPELASAQSQLAGLEQQINLETSRILRAARLDLDQANSVVASLRQQSLGARSAVSLDNDAQVTLNDLERDMTAKTTIYQTFLNRAEEIAQRQQIDTTNIRIVSTALPPTSRSWPPRTLLLGAAGTVLGGGVGVFLALLFGFTGAFTALRRKNEGVEQADYYR